MQGLWNRAIGDVLVKKHSACVGTALSHCRVNLDLLCIHCIDDWQYSVRLWLQKTQGSEFCVQCCLFSVEYSWVICGCLWSC